MKMKRIANNVALQTIGYVISGFTTNPFLILFDDLDGVTSTGIWNESLQRIEC